MCYARVQEKHTCWVLLVFRARIKYLTSPHLPRGFFGTASQTRVANEDKREIGD